MKKAITIVALGGSLLIILGSFHVGEALTLFMLAGVIPGTNILISPTQTLVLIGLISGFALSRLITPRLTTRKTDR